MAATRLTSACRSILRPALASTQMRQVAAPMAQASMLTSMPTCRGFCTTGCCRKTEIPLPDNLEHAVGIEKFEKLAKLAVSAKYTHTMNFPRLRRVTPLMLIGIKNIFIHSFQGIDDPWDLKPFQMGAGTKDEPTLLPSMYNRRLVGHLCEEDQTHLTYFYVYKGFPKRCQCGHWFKVVDAEPYHY